MNKPLIILLLLCTLSFSAWGQHRVIDSLKKELALTESGPARVDLYNSLSWELHEMDVVETEMYADKAIALSKTIPYPKGLARGLNLKAIALSDAGDRVAAMAANRKALNIAVEINDLFLLSMINNDLAISYSELDDHTQALKHYHASLDAARDLGSARDIAWTMGNLGSELVYEGEEEEGNKYLEEAIELSKTVDDPMLKINILGIKGSMLDNAQKWEQADKIYRERLALAEANGLLAVAARSYINIGVIHKRKGEKQKGLEAFLKARKYYQQSGKRMMLAFVSNYIAKTYRDLDDLPNAMIFSREALEESIATDARDNFWMTYWNLSESYRLLGKWDSAYHYENKLRLFESKDYEKRLEKGLGNAELKYQLEKESEKNEMLTALSERDEALLEKRTLMLIASIGALLLVAIMAILLYRTNQKNKQIGHFKNKLFSIVSHDLRAPMSSLKGLIDAIRQGYFQPEELPVMLDMLDKEMTQTDELLNNLLHWSKSQLEGLKPKPKSVSISKIVDDSIKLFQPIADKKQIKLEADIPEQSSVYADPEMLKLVVRNLLSNAVKFSREGGEIKLDSGVERDQVFVKITDEGVGISEEIQKKLEDQEHISTLGTQEERGTGLGLLLVQDFIQKNKGRFWFSSEKGKGSMFAFSFPQQP